MSAAHYTLYKGGLFSYIGELRIPVNKVPLVDYTGWTITGRIEDVDGNELPILTVEWIDITTGIFRFKIAPADHTNLRVGRDYKLYIVPVTAAAEALVPIIFTVAVKET
jgi:hypothetical protein